MQSTADTASPLDTALMVVKQWPGARVFPVVGKRPAPEVRHWNTEATADPQQVAAWFTGTTYGVGVTGILAIDGDNLAATYEAFPESLTTGAMLWGNPDHSSWLFQQPDDPYGDGSHPGGEVKGSGYMVLPPSLHDDPAKCGQCAETGPHPYQWGGDPHTLPVLPYDISQTLDTLGVRRQAARATTSPSLGVPPEWVTTDPPCQAIATALTDAQTILTRHGAAKHPAMGAGVLRILRLGEQGHHGAGSALTALRSTFTAACAQDGPQRVTEALTEWPRSVQGAVDLIHRDGLTHVFDRQCCGGAPVIEDVSQEGESTGRHHDLSWVLTGEVPASEPPQYLTRRDGNALFYPQRVNGLFGDPECGKTWIALAGAVEAMGERVAVVDIDHNGAVDTVRRLLALGAKADVLADGDRFRYFAPEDRESIMETFAAVHEWEAGYVIVDSLGELIPMLGADSKDNDGVGMVMRSITRLTHHACVVTIDHLPKDRAARETGFAIGVTAKKRAIRGAYLRVTRITPFAIGQVGRAALTIEKDTPSGLREHSPAGYAGTFVLDSTMSHLGALTYRVETDNDDGDHVKHTPTMAKVLHWLTEVGGEHSTSAVAKGAGVNWAKTMDALHALTAQGQVSRRLTITGTREDNHWQVNDAPQLPL